MTVRAHLLGPLARLPCGALDMTTRVGWDDGDSGLGGRSGLCGAKAAGSRLRGPHARVAGDGYGLGTVDRPQFEENGGDVVLNRLEADTHASGDGVVA